MRAEPLEPQELKGRTEKLSEPGGCWSWSRSKRRSGPRRRSSGGNGSWTSFARALGATRERPSLPPLYDRRAGRNRQDDARPRAPRRGRRLGHRSRSGLPLLRRGDHLPRPDRDREEARRRGARSPDCRADRGSRRSRARRQPDPSHDRPLERVAAGPRRPSGLVRRLFEAVARDRALSRGRGGRPLGGADARRPARVPGLVLRGGADLHSLPCAPRAPRSRTRPGRRRIETARSVVLEEPPSGQHGSSSIPSPRGASCGCDAERIVETAEGNPSSWSSLWPPRPSAARANYRRASRPSWPPASRAWKPASGRCSSAPRSRAATSSGARSQRFSPRATAPVLGHHLMALIRRQLIQPDPSAFAGEDAFRFSHVLIQEAAYNGLPKELCAELHERLADRLALTQEGEDEIVGYHLEQAYRCRHRLGLLATTSGRLRRRQRPGSRRPHRKTLLRGDSAAAAGLLERAASLLSREDPSRLDLLPALGAALFEAGQLADADRVLGRGNRALDGRAPHGTRAGRAAVRAAADGHRRDRRRGASRRRRPSRCSRERGDDFGQIRAWSLKAFSAWIVGQAAKADEARRRGAEHARRAGETRELFEILDWRASAAVIGPTPVDEAIERCLEIREQVRSSPVAMAETLHPLAVLRAMRGEFEAARTLIREGNAIIEELGRISSRGSPTTRHSSRCWRGSPKSRRNDCDVPTSDSKRWARDAACERPPPG